MGSGMIGLRKVWCFHSLFCLALSWGLRCKSAASSATCLWHLCHCLDNTSVSSTHWQHLFHHMVLTLPFGFHISGCCSNSAYSIFCFPAQTTILFQYAVNSSKIVWTCTGFSNYAIRYLILFCHVPTVTNWSASPFHSKKLANP